MLPIPCYFKSQPRWKLTLEKLTLKKLVKLSKHIVLLVFCSVDTMSGVICFQKHLAVLNMFSLETLNGRIFLWFEQIC